MRSIMDSNAVAARATTLMARLILRRKKIQAQRKRSSNAIINNEKDCSARTAVVECIWGVSFFHCKARHQHTPTSAPMMEKERAILPHNNTRLNLDNDKEEGGGVRE